jgi:hypothetical protein
MQHKGEIGILISRCQQRVACSQQIFLEVLAITARPEKTKKRFSVC